jgi:succinate dehydrogenase/fumarate reductase flavoprotein subunit
MVNSEGKEILHQYDPRGLYTTRDVRANAIYCERRERKKVYLDLTHVPWEIIEQEFGSRFKGSYLPMLTKEGFDLNKTPIEVSIGAHYCMGGIRINEKGETCVPGLFAAGEVTGGIDGANRLGGNALTEVMVMGHITGETASNYAASVGEANAGRDQIDSEARNAFEIIEKTRRSDLVSPVAARRQLQQALWSHVCVRRTEKGLKEALQTIEKLREKKLPRLGLHSPAKVYNLEWVQALQLPAQLDVAEAVVRAALARTESRGAHQRDDHPEQDDKNWVKNIVLKRAKAGFELNINPAVITKLPISEALP